MTWHEFSGWAARNGWTLPPFIGGNGHGGASNICRVLGVEHPGSGRHRTYGRREQRRLAMWQAIRTSMGTINTRRSPEWMMDAVGIAGDTATGWVCHSDGRTWWTDKPDPLPHLTAGIFAAPIWRP